MAGRTATTTDELCCPLMRTSNRVFVCGITLNEYDPVLVAVVRRITEYVVDGRLYASNSTVVPGSAAPLSVATWPAVMSAEPLSTVGAGGGGVGSDDGGGSNETVRTVSVHAATE